MILDDDDDATWATLQFLQDRDFRVRVYRPSIRAGRIGEAKLDAFMLARGKVIVEMDHDDELSDDCLLWLKDAFVKYPNRGLYYTETVEPDEVTDRCNDYGEYFGFGYGQWSVWSDAAGTARRTSSVLANRGVRARQSYGPAS